LRSIAAFALSRVANSSGLDAGVVLNQVEQASAFPWRGHVYLLTVVFDVWLAAHFEADMVEQPLHQVHDVFQVGVCLIEFQQGVFGVMAAVHALVAEHAPDFVHLLDVAHDEALEVQLQ
jgi:hypothetical protein